MKILTSIKLTSCAVLLAVTSLQAQEVAPTITTQPASVSLGLNSTAYLTVAGAGLTNAYFWTKDGSAQGSTSNTCPIVTTSAATNSYQVIITNTAGSVTSSVATVAVLSAPAITVQPANVAIVKSATTTLSVTATGGSPLTYIWKQNSAIKQAGTGNTYAFSSATPGVYNFTCTVTNLSGSVTSTAVNVTVLAAPTITKNLDSKTVGLSSNYTFTVTGLSPSGTFTWYFCTNTAASGATTNTLGSTTNFFTLTNAQYANQGSYWVVLSNAVSVVTSSNATLTVLKAPAFTAHLSCTNGVSAGNTNTVPKGSALSFASTVTGDSLSYIWLQDTKVISTATNTLSITATNATTTAPIKYYLIISNAVAKATSTNFVNVIAPPAISVQPTKTLSVVDGKNLSLSVTASGTKPYTNLVYQWSLEGVSISNATNSTLVVSNVASGDAGKYQVVVTNFGGSTTSSISTVTVAADTGGITLMVNAETKWLTNATYVLKGTAKDNASITNVSFSLNSETNYATVSTTNAFATWFATNTLQVGTNVFYVRATDINSNTTNKTVKVVYAPFLSATITTNGTGGITGVTNRLQWGVVATLTAKPGVRNQFAGWSGLDGVVLTNSTTTNSLVFKFLVTNTVACVANFSTNNFYDTAGTYNGLFYETNGVTHDTAGFVTVTVATNLAYSGKVIMAGKTLAVSGKVGFDGVATSTMNVKATNDTTLSFTLDGYGALSGTVSSSTTTSLLTGDLAVFSKTNAATKFSGIYTLVIPPATTGAVTNGYGYGTVTVTTNGIATLTGSTADGAPLAQTVAISKNGDWPLFAPLYSTKTNYTGELIGWLQFATNGFTNATGPVGDVTWIKVGKMTNEVTIDSSCSSPYKTPTKASPKVLPDFVWGTIWFTGGNLTNDIGAWMFMSKNGTTYAYEDSTTIKFTSAGGLLSGKFLNNGTGKTAPYYGVVLQNSTNALGYFGGGTNAIGTVQIDYVPTGPLTAP